MCESNTLADMNSVVIQSRQDKLCASLPQWFVARDTWCNSWSRLIYTAPSGEAAADCAAGENI